MPASSGWTQGLAGLLRAAARAAEDAAPSGSASSGPETAARSAARPRLTSVPNRARCSAGADQLLEGPVGVAGVQREQAAGHQRHRRRAVGPGRDAGPGAGQEHDRLDRRLLRVEDQAGAAAADPGAGRQGDGHHEAGGDRRIHRGAAGREHLPAGQRRGRVLGGDAAEEAADEAGLAFGRAAPAERVQAGQRLAARQRQGAHGKHGGAQPAADHASPRLPPWAGQAAPGYDARHAEGVGPVLGAAGHAGVPGPSLAPIAARAQSGASAVITIRDAETEAFLRRIAHPLFRAAGVDPALVRITLVQARPINAFVTSGNRMFINTGLIQQSDSVAELAGVLAHETGHIAGGHVARLPEEMRNAFIRSIAGLVLGGAAAMAAAARSAARPARPSCSAARPWRWASSMPSPAPRNRRPTRPGSPISTGSAGPPRAGDAAGPAAGAGDAGGGPAGPLFPHPSAVARPAGIRRRPPGPQPAGRGALARHAGIRLPAGPRQAGRLHRPADDHLEALPRKRYRPPARYARAIAQYRSGRTDQAIALLAPMLREQPGNPWLRELQGQILFEAGRPREAVAPLPEAARLAPSEALIRTALGRALMEAGEPLLRAAAAEFEASLRPSATTASPGGSSASCRAAGAGPQADLALAEEAMLDGDFPNARRLARQAEEALPPGPLKLRAEDLREAARRDNLTREQREQDDAMRRRQPR